MIDCYDSIKSNEVKIIEVSPDEHYQIKLKDNVTTGYWWIYEIENKNENQTFTEEIGKESLPTEQSMKGYIGAPTVLIYTFKSKKSDTIKFYHVRPWLKQKTSELVSNFEIQVCIKN